MKMIRNGKLVLCVTQGVGILFFFAQWIGIDPKGWENYGPRVVLPREHLRFVGGTQARDGSRQNGWFVDDSGELLSPVVGVPVMLVTGPSPVVVVCALLAPFWHL